MITAIAAISRARQNRSSLPSHLDHRERAKESTGLRWEYLAPADRLVPEVLSSVEAFVEAFVCCGNPMSDTQAPWFHLTDWNPGRSWSGGEPHGATPQILRWSSDAPA